MRQKSLSQRTPAEHYVRWVALADVSSNGSQSTLYFSTTCQGEWGDIRSVARKLLTAYGRSSWQGVRDMPLSFLSVCCSQQRAPCRRFIKLFPRTLFLHRWPVRPETAMSSPVSGNMLTALPFA